MKTKIRKLLFEYSINSRITTKELGKRIGASQQSTSYLLNTLKKKKLIGSNTTVIDAIKLGFIKVIVGFDFLDPSFKKEIIDDLLNVASITSIEEGKEGVDLSIEYTVQNLSAFNKIHSELIYKFYKKLKTRFIFPLIVSHNYCRNYLTRKFDRTDIILFGDRITRELTKNESIVLNELSRNSDKKLIEISESLKMPIKTVVRIKKSLEKKYIIRGYSTILNHNKLGINRQIILLKFSSEGINKIDEFTDFSRNNKNIVGLVKIIGQFDIAIYVESLKEIEIIKDIRASFSIEDYLIIQSEKIHKKTHLPQA